MKQILTEAIVLSRTNYGEADRIITVLTPEHGKVRLMAKGVRKSTSKLAGGIELFSVSQLSYIPGRGDISTLVSTRLVRHFGSIVEDLSRTMLGYELIKRLNRITEDAAEHEYYDLLLAAFGGLNDRHLSADLVAVWFDARLLALGGHQPNLRTDTTGQKLEPQARYTFDFDATAFAPFDSGKYGARHIKLLRLLFGMAAPEPLRQVRDVAEVLDDCRQLVGALYDQHLPR